MNITNGAIMIRYLILCIAILLSSHVLAEDKKEEPKDKKEIAEETDENPNVPPKYSAKEERSKIKFKLIPGPTFGPSVGLGLLLVPMLVYYPDKNDLVSPPSQTAAFYLITSNKSTMGGIAQKLFLKEDTWRIDFGIYAGSINMDVDIKDSEGDVLESIESARKFRYIKLDVNRRVWNDLFLGIGGKGLNTWFEADNSADEEIIEETFGAKGNVQWGVVGRTFFDNRDNVYYPYKGIYTSYAYDYNFENQEYEAYSGNSYDIRYFQKIHGYRHILAMHFYGRIIERSAPDNVIQFYGRAAQSTQRGFVVGQYYDRNVLSSDLEYRYISPFIQRKLGFAAFANFGKVYGEAQPFEKAKWLIGGGVGVRYFILPYERIHAVLDAAWSKDTFAMYFGLKSPF